MNKRIQKYWRRRGKCRNRQGYRPKWRWRRNRSSGTVASPLSLFSVLDSEQILRSQWKEKLIDFILAYNNNNNNNENNQQEGTEVKVKGRQLC